MSNQTEQNYIATRAAFHRAIEAFKMSPEITAYIDASMEAIKVYAAEHYPDIAFKVASSYNAQAQPHKMDIDFGVEMMTSQPIEDTVLIRIHQEVNAYLDQLGNDQGMIEQ